MIWKAHKAVIRGVLIKQGTRIKWEREAKLTTLLTDIHRLEVLHKYAPSLDVERDLLKTRRHVTDMLFYEAKKAIQMGSKQAYESGNKYGKTLARALTNVPLIVGEDGEKCILLR